MADLADRDNPREIIDSARVYHGRIWDVIRDQIDLGHGRVVERDYVDHTSAVAILAIDENDDVALIRQYRHPVRRDLWEIPAGLLDVEGEAPLAAAQRELAEESDLQAKQWEELTRFYTTPGGSNEQLIIYVARDISVVPLQRRHERRDEEEDLEIVFVPFRELLDAVVAGNIMNPATVIGVLNYAQHRGWQRHRD